MKRLKTPKRVFTFTLGDEDTVYGVDDLDGNERMQSVHSNWVVSEMTYEREWRNYELSETDYMLVSDATYGGETIADSTMKSDILDYRSALRAYNLKDDDRPVRPDWYLD